MQGQLHFSDTVYGLGAGMFFAGYLIFQVPSNLVLKRAGARRWLSSLMIAWGIVSASMVFVTTPRSFYVLRFLLGLAESGFFPGIILYLGYWIPAAARARTIALFLTANPISGVIGGPLSGAILGLQNRHGLAGWQWLFLLEGSPAVDVYKRQAHIPFMIFVRSEDVEILQPNHPIQRSILPGVQIKLLFRSRVGIQRLQPRRCV